MIYNKEIGCGFDTIIYGMLEFSKDNYVNDFTKKFGFTDPLAFYDEFKDSVNISILSELLPFFFTDGEQMCFLTSYYYYEFDKFTKSFSEFLNQVKSDENIVKKIYIYYLNEKYNQETIPIDDPAKIFEEIIELELDSTLAKQLLNVYKSQIKTIDTLISYLYEVYTKLCKFHEKMYIKYKNSIDSLFTENMINTIKIYCNVDEHINIKEQTMSICFMLKYILFHQFGRNEDNILKYIFIMGLDSEKHITRLINYNNITIETIFTALSHPVKRDILEKLKAEPYSATQLAESLFSVRQSINRHLLDLNELKIIQIKEMQGKEVFYTINKKVLNISKSVFCEYIDNLTN